MLSGYAVGIRQINQLITQTHTLDINELNECLRTLDKKPIWPFRTDNTAEKLRCLDTLYSLGITSGIGYLVPYLKSEDLAVRHRTAELIVSLYDKINHPREYADALKRAPIHKADLDRFKSDFDGPTYLRLLCIASFNANGYVREKAVKLLTVLGKMEAFPVVLQRLADWVPAVRKAAEIALSVLLDQAGIDDLLPLLPDLDWLLKVQRVDLNATHDKILDIILQHDFSTVLYPKIIQLDDRTRLQFFKAFLKRNQPNEALLRKISVDKNILVRLLLFENLSFCDNGINQELLDLLLNDKSARVRLMALYTQRQSGQLPDDQVTKMLSDRSASIRDLCRSMLKSSGLDFAQLYRNRLASGNDLAGNLSGLAETGNARDVPQFEKYISCANGKLTVVCLYAINKFNPAKAKTYGLELLGHQTGQIRRAAATILVNSSEPDILPRLRARYPQADYMLKKTLLQLYFRKGGWPVVADLLLGTMDEQSNIQNLSWQLLEAWRLKAQKLFTVPDTNDIRHAIQRYEQLLQSGTELSYHQEVLLREIRFLLE